MELYTLETLSERLGGVPLSTLKHRIAQLGIQPTARGSRNKLLFDERAAALIEASDQLLRQGNGLSTTRRMLGLEEGAVPPSDLPEEQPFAPAETPRVTMAPPDQSALDRLSHALTHALAQIEEKDQQIARLHEELRKSTEAAATFQQKTFYLQAELQRLQGDLKEAMKRASEKGWKGLFRRETP